MQDPLHNPFKAGLARGETQLGLWLSSTSSIWPRSPPPAAMTGC